ncbi:acyl-CoA synthetase [soil metagenome]
MGEGATEEERMSHRKYELGTYEEMRAAHRWDVPERYNIASDVCDKHPRDKLAMVWEDWRGAEREVRFGELQDLSRRFANVLAANGVERGDRVATLLPSLPETAAAFFGTYRSGAILLSMSVLYGDEGIQHRLKDSGAKAVVTDTANRDRIPDGLAEVVLVLDSDDGSSEDGERQSGDVDLGAALEQASDRHEAVDTSADDPAQLYYSSGTTGLAKGILHAHRYILGHEEFEFCHDVRKDELFHGSGEWAWAAGIAPLLGPWRYGATQFVYARKGGFDPEEQLRQLEKHGVQNMFTTPTALRAMTAVADAGKKYPLERLRVTCSAGEPLNPEVIRWFREQFGITILDYYGLTESYPLCANYPTVEVREGSMGLPMPGWDVAILDEDEKPLPPGERGEICLRARSNPHYPLGYWNRPEDSEEDFGGGWFHTKDAAEADEDGYFWYSGRADDVIISAGYRIGPFEVESACVEHAAVHEAAAVASPDEKRGDLVKAFIVLAEGYEPTDDTAREIREYVRDRHSKYAYPREIEFVDDLPKTLTGKIRRIDLRDAEREKKKAAQPAR